jgi:hypothetical protein
VRSLFHDLAVLDYKYAIGTADLFERKGGRKGQKRVRFEFLRATQIATYCRKTMSHDNNCHRTRSIFTLAPRQHFVNGFLNEMFAFRIQRASRLVKKK